LDVEVSNNSTILTASVVTNPATLKIEPLLSQAGTVRLSWPVAATNFVLQSTDNITSDTRWQSVTLPPTISGTQKNLALPIVGPHRFYRLTRP
jgi:hypothetical protein